MGGKQIVKLVEQKTCANCNADLFRCQLVEFDNGTRHVGAYCSKCNKMLQWVPSSIESKESLVHVGEIEMPFGKFKGTKIKDLPKSYLEFMTTWTDKPKFSLGAANLLKDGIKSA